MECRYSQNPTVESAPMQGESVLYNPGNNRFCLLNSTAAFLWSKLETPQSVQELAECIESHFEGIDAGHAHSDIEAALAQLVDVDCVVKKQTD
jgi:hypothetical protein